MCAVSFSDFSEKDRNMLRRSHFWQCFFDHKWTNGTKVYHVAGRCNGFRNSLRKTFPNKLGNMHRCVHAFATCGE